MNTVLLELKARPDNTVWKALSIQRAPFFLFFLLERQKKRKSPPTLPPVSSCRTNSFSKFPLESRRLRQQQAVFGSPESSRLPVFPELWLLSAIWSPHAQHTHINTARHTRTCTQTHTHAHKLARSWWREQVRESCTCCPVNKIPQSDAETSSFTQRSFPQVWEHECGTKHADCHQPELTRRPGSKAASSTWRPPGPQRSGKVLPLEIQVKLLLEIHVLKARQSWWKLRNPVCQMQVYSTSHQFAA